MSLSICGYSSTLTCLQGVDSKLLCPQTLLWTSTMRTWNKTKQKKKKCVSSNLASWRKCPKCVLIESNQCIVAFPGKKCSPSCHKLHSKTYNSCFHTAGDATRKKKKTQHCIQEVYQNNSTKEVGGGKYFSLR